MAAVYSFANGPDIVDVNFDPSTRQITPISRYGYPLPDRIPDDVPQMPDEHIVSSFCDEGDMIVIRAITTNPFAFVQVVENSPECRIVTPPPEPDPEPDPDEPPTEPAPERTVYRVRWKNFEETLLTVDIIDRQNYTPEATEKVIPLEGAGNPLSVSVVDNNEDPLTPIRAKEGVIKFNSTPTIGLSNFIEGEDNRWYVIAYHGQADPEQLIFQGFLTFSDSSEPFLPAPNEVTLVATDNLGLLKDVPMTKPDGTNPKGEYKIIEYLAWCLQKTGLTMAIRVAHNLREQHTPLLPMYETCYLNAKTFEDEIGTSISCYEVIERILGEDAFLVQMAGEWWIIRPDEMQGGQYLTWRFDGGGIFIPTTIIENPVVYDAVKHLGENEVRYWSNEATNVLINRPNREVKEVYRYDYPKEIIDNIDFSRGEQILIGGGPSTGIYRIEDWTVGRYRADSELPQPTVVNAFIRREFFEGYEKERYAVVGFSNEASPFTYIRANPVPVMAKDRISVSVDFRFNKSTVGNDVNPLAIILKTRDGAYYYPTDTSNNGGGWFPASNFGNALFFTGSHEYQNDSEKTAWANLEVSVIDIPADGEIYIYLMAGYNHGGSGNPEAHYKNLRFTYTPYINGGYAEHDGQFNRVSQPGKYQSAHEAQVYIADSPRILFKGALLRKSGDKFVLAGNFSHPAYPDFQKPFGWWQAFAAWYLKRRTMRMFEGELRGLDVEESMSDCVHQWQITDTTEHTEGKTFMLLHYDMDYTDCGGPVVLHEVSDEGQEKTFEDTHEFRYLEKR